MHEDLNFESAFENSSGKAGKFSRDEGMRGSQH